jgi:hypothetical protein
VAVGLAAFSGLGWPGQIRRLAFRNLVELSLTKRRFLEVPSRIQLLGIRNRRAAVIRYSTFLSSRGCGWLLEDLKSRSPPPRAESQVVTEQAFKDAERAVRAAGLRWYDLRDYFYATCVKVGVSQRVVGFMLGHVAQREDHIRDMLSREIDFLRKEPQSRRALLNVLDHSQRK